jgi:hypothetical protein
VSEGGFDLRRFLFLFQMETKKIEIKSICAIKNENSPTDYYRSRAGWSVAASPLGLPL